MPREELSRQLIVVLERDGRLTVYILSRLPGGHEVWRRIDTVRGFVWVSRDELEEDWDGAE